MLGVVVVQAGLTVLVLGGLSLVRPLSILGIRTRRRGLVVVLAGMALAAAGMLLPAGETRVAVPRTHLDEFAPAYQFHESHEIHIAAPEERVYQAVNEVTANEIFLFRTLTWIRRLGRAGPESILDAPEEQPLLDVATRTSFLTLAEEPSREVLVGTLVVAPADLTIPPEPTPSWFKALDRPGFAKATMNFRVEAAAPGRCVLTTETRVYATDGASRRRFAAYWRVIYPGSSLIRRMWLRAIKRRAEMAS